MATTFESLDPATDRVVGTYPALTPAEVDEVVAQARAATSGWAALGFGERRAHLTRWKQLIVQRMAELVQVVCDETGKPAGDAQLEVSLALGHLAWAAGHARRVLGRRYVAPGLLTANFTATVEYLPLGVVGVIGPWNYPVFTPMGSIAYALAAGNAVVFKPSELTPGVAQWLADSFAEAVPEHPVFRVVTGFGETGAALCRSDVDKLSFTGSTATAKKVCATCAESLMPVLVEAGGKDALLVAADADVEAAADAAVWGAMANAGQTCIGIERAYVHTDVFEAFLSEVYARSSALRAAVGEQVGPITLPRQVDVIRDHITDAVGRGGRSLVGGLAGVGDHFVQPTVLVDVPEESTAVTEETFGPTLTVTRVADMDEAVRLTNAGRYGLGAAVFARSGGAALARRIRSGMTSVNSVISFAGIASLPFGGVGDSGFGRIHGADGLREFAYAKSVAQQRFPPVLALTTFARGPAVDARLARVTSLVHGGPPAWRSLLGRRVPRSAPAD